MNRFYKGDKCKRCGKDITIKNKSGHCRSCGQIGHKRNIGKKKSAEEKRAISVRMTGNKNPMWGGNNISYSALHEWVRKHKPKPIFCEKCKKSHAYDLANKGKYNRNFENWEYLCRKCHMIGDGRINNLKQFNEKG